MVDPKSHLEPPPEANEYKCKCTMTADQSRSAPMITEQLIPNELLAFAFGATTRHPKDDVRMAILSFYTPEDIIEGKKLLWEAYGAKLSPLQLRKDTTKRRAYEADLTDIMQAVYNLDAKEDYADTTFVVKDIFNLPSLIQNSPAGRLESIETTVREICNMMQQLPATPQCPPPRKPVPDLDPDLAQPPPTPFADTLKKGVASGVEECIPDSKFTTVHGRNSRSHSTLPKKVVSNENSATLPKAPVNHDRKKPRPRVQRPTVNVGTKSHASFKAGSGLKAASPKWTYLRLLLSSLDVLCAAPHEAPVPQGREACSDMEEGFRFERMAQNFDHVAEMHDFWTQNSAAQHPNSVDGARSDVEIVSVFKQKYSNLYNSVGYDHRVLDDTRDRVNELFSSHEASDCHAITLHEVKTAVSQLKRNKHDGLADISTDHLKNAPQPFLSHLTTFFNGLLTHGFSPNDFNVAVLIPIRKNKLFPKSSSLKENIQRKLIPMQNSILPLSRNQNVDMRSA
ncbi:hypothetical protein CAPTEDRAFT_194995 [Capitella teleta]|uniref:Uncharacterized protein n=1 Tax=Capitella teleta TaxID=283909 RepID=R7U3G6_CAPTE|nr:hypothetical protein CAPTEDRAFT_194995 [Capitella teleta]|eukprot:ELU00504.1 hypothetical protein CAPTEDRAFT_194995 [Capitella teleta]